MRRDGKILLILISYLLSAWFILDPGPLPMALFVFIAQPFIFLGSILYIAEVLRELKQRGVL